MIVCIVYFSLIALGIAWMRWFLSRDKCERFWVYRKTGTLYGPVRRCRMKNPTTGDWVDAIIYVKGENVYVRDELDFLLNFEQLGQWEKNGMTVSKRHQKADKQTS